MDGKKNLSAARKKLQEYKISKGIASHVTPTGGTTFKELDETDPAAPTSTSPYYFVPVPTSTGNIQCPQPSPPCLKPTPPPTENIPEFLNNLSQNLQPTNGTSSDTAEPEPFEYKIMNVDDTSTSTSSPAPTSTSLTSTAPVNDSAMSNIFQSSPNNDHVIFTPSAPAMPHNSQHFNHIMQPHPDYGHTQANQNFPVNFFQSTPIAQDYQHQHYQHPPSSFIPQGDQHDHDGNVTSYPQTQSPLFYNVDGSNITPMPPLQPSSFPFGFDNSHSHVPDGNATVESQNPFSPTTTTENQNEALAHQNQNVDIVDNQGQVQGTILTSEEGVDVELPQPDATSHTDKENTEVEARNQGALNFHTHADVNVHVSRSTNSPIPDVEMHLPPPDNQVSTGTTTPTSTRTTSRDNSEVPIGRRTPTPTMKKMSASASSQEEKERLEIQAWHRMKSVQDALELQLEELRRDNERLLQRQAELVSQIEDNEKIVQEIRKERDRCKEDAKKYVQPLNIKINNMYEENQRILKNSSEVGMELRGKLQEKSKQYEDMEQAFIIVSKSKMDLAAELDQEKEKTKELDGQLRNKEKEINDIQNRVTQLEENQKDGQKKDAFIHQLEDQKRYYQAQTESLIRQLEIANNRLQEAGVSVSPLPGSPSPIPHTSGVENPHPLEGNHTHSETCDHQHDDNGHNHNHEHLDDHKEHDHSHAHDHHNHDHQHHHDHDHEHGPTVASDMQENGHRARHPTSEADEMKKRLHHLEWENSTFKSDLDKLAEEARERRNFEEKYTSAAQECEKLRDECQRLELLIVQLQGENDTIGDYIALYQSQRLALKESAKEKDLQLENLAKEREMLLRKMEELTQLLKTLKDTGGCGPVEHQCPGHDHDHGSTKEGGEIEGRIRNLLTEISSSSLIENFHPCAVCSGRLMNV